LNDSRDPARFHVRVHFTQNTPEIANPRQLTTGAAGTIGWHNAGIESPAMRATTDWPLRYLNVFVMPLGLVLAVVRSSVLKALAIAAVVGLVIAATMSAVWLSSFRAALRRNPLQQLAAGVEGLTSRSHQRRFLIIQTVSGALIAVMWYAVARGVVALVSRLS
jgi:hypothetical protein